MTDIESLVLYMCIFILSIFFVWIYQRFRIYEKPVWKRCLIIFGITLPVIILQGFRYEVGTDYKNYVRIFEDIKEGSFYYKSYLSEPLFLRINLILKAVFKSPLSYFVFTAIIMNILFFFVVDYYRHSVDMPMVYFAYYMLCFSVFLNVERQAVAGLLFWFSIRFIERKQPVKFFLVILCASLIHNTAIIFLAFYLINIFNNKKYRTLVRMTAGIGFTFFLLFFDKIVQFGLKFVTENSKYVMYILKDEHDIVISENTIFLYWALICLPIVLGYTKLNKEETNHYIMLICIGMQFIFIFLVKYVSYGDRLIFYMYIGLLIYIGRICKCMYFQSNQLIIKGYLIMSLLIYYYRIYYLFGHAGVFPYQFWKN